MKNTRVCPKCGGMEILVIGGSTGPYGVGNNIPAGKTVFSYVNVDRYLCALCGYSEEWIDVADMPRIKKKYGKK